MKIYKEDGSFEVSEGNGWRVVTPARKYVWTSKGAAILGIAIGIVISLVYACYLYC